MAAAPAQAERRRPRPGSLERPVSARMYRGTWLLVALPLLVAAFSVAHPAPLAAPPLPAAFDRNAAAALASDLARSFPDRSPGSPQALGAAQWFEQQLSAYGFQTHVARFSATIPGRGRVRLENLSTVAPGSSPDTIVVMAHRDNTGTSPGANDNASGTAALIELARGYANVGGGRRATPAHRILFLSTDGGAFGGLGAEHFAVQAARRNDVVAVLNLDALGGVGRPRLEIAGDTSPSPAASLVPVVDLAQGTSTYVYLGSRLIRGWAIELVLIAALLPFFAAAVDLFARCRRRRIPLAPAFRSYLSRLGFWLCVGGLFELFRLAGAWPAGAGVPPSPQSSVATHWPVVAMLGFLAASVVAWFVARDRLIPRRRIGAGEEVAGYAAALLAPGVVSLPVG